MGLCNLKWLAVVNWYNLALESFCSSHVMLLPDTCTAVADVHNRSVVYMQNLNASNALLSRLDAGPIPSLPGQWISCSFCMLSMR